MTNWVKSPEVTVELNHGKGAKAVTGQVRVTVNRPGYAFVGTQAHNNDDAPAVTVRGKDYLVNLHFVQQADGSWAEHPDNRPQSVSPRGLNYRWDAAAAPTIRAAVVAAALAALAEHAPAMAGQAAAAHAAQQLSGSTGLEAKIEELRAQLAELEAQAAQHRATLEANKQHLPKPLTLAEKRANEEIRRARYANRWAARFLAETPEGEAHPEPTDEVMFARFRDTIVAPKVEYYPVIREAIKAQIEALKEGA